MNRKQRWVKVKFWWVYHWITSDDRYQFDGDEVKEGRGGGKEEKKDGWLGRRCLYHFEAK